jgi:hypothetical protein
MKLRTAFAAACLAVCLAPAWAQNRNAGEIRGTVVDQTEAAVPGVLVSIRNVQTGVVQQFSTNSAGVYVAPSVLAGDYTVTFSKEGFRKLVRSGISLNVQTITVDGRLELGSLSQEVSVNAQATLVQTETAERSSTILGPTIREMPLVGRDTYALTALLPGVNNGNGNNASGPGVGFNGTAAYQANFTVDGGSNVRPISQNLGTSPPLETIEELNFRTSNFGAEFGNGLAVVSVITKSGTNRFKGSLFYFHQNNAFNARNFFQPTVAAFRWHQYGGTIGGPIKKDRTFFFFSYQRQQRLNYSSGFYTFPTTSMRQGDFSGLAPIYDPDTLSNANGVWTRQPLFGNQVPPSRIDSVAKNIQSYYPMPTLPGTFRNFWLPMRTSYAQDWYNLKIDHNIAATNRLTGTVMISPVDQVYAGPNCPIATGSGSRDCASYPIISWDAQVTDVWTISPAKVNEFRVTMNRNGQEITPPSMNAGYPQKLGLKNMQGDTFPNIGIGGAIGITGIGTGLASPLYQNAFMYSDMMTWTIGRHIIKFGGQFDRYQVNQAWNRLLPADMSFNGLFTRNPAAAGSSTGLGYADFLFGLPQTWSANVAPLTGARGSNFQAFIQDDYKIRPNLTLSFGVRWMIQPGWNEHHDRLANFDPQLNNPATNTRGALRFGGSLQETRYAGVAPRLGFAWSPRQKWSVRGGYGMFNIMNGANTFAPNIGLGWTVSGFRTSTDQMTPIFRMQDGLPNVVVPSDSTRTPNMLNGQNLTYLPSITPLTFIHQYQLGVQHELPGRWLVDVAYVGTKGQNLGFGRDMNQVPASALGPGNAQLRRPYPQFANITRLNFDGRSNYNSLQVLVRKDLSRGLSLQTSYTFSKALDTGAGHGWGGTTSIGVWQIASAPELNYSLSTLDLTHLFNGGLVWQLPVGKGRALLDQGGILNAILGGWQLSNVWQLHTGTPFTPTIGTPNLSGALSGTWLPNRLGTGTVANPTIQKWFDTSAFVAPPQFTFGNSGRNILRGPNYANLDLSLSKNFTLSALREGMWFQLRLDSSNVLNHTNFGQPNSGLGAQGVGGIFSALASRTVQLGGRWTF